MKKIKHLLSFLVFSTFLLALAACASHPLGMSTAEWEALSPNQQHQARMAQEKRDEAERQRQAEIRQRQAEKHAEWARKELAEEARIEAGKKNPAYGDLVQCRITNAKGDFGKSGWQPAQELSVAIYRGETVDALIYRQGNKSGYTTVQLRFDGLNVRACRRGGRDCDTMAGSERQFARGLSKRIAIHKTVQGTLSCSFPTGSPRGYKSPRRR